MTAAGDLQFVVKFPKYKKGEFRVDVRKQAADFGSVLLYLV